MNEIKEVNINKKEVLSWDFIFELNLVTNKKIIQPKPTWHMNRLNCLNIPCLMFQICVHLLLSTQVFSLR